MDRNFRGGSLLAGVEQLISRLSAAIMENL
jgi:hypothetical protein